MPAHSAQLWCLCIAVVNMNVKQALDLFKTGLEASISGLGAVAAVVAEEGSGLLGQSKLLHNYKLGQPQASCGPGDIWGIYAGTSKKPGAIQKDVSIWILDKKRVQETAKQASKVRFDHLFEQQKRACQHMTRLKHPGVIKVIEPLDDQSQQMVFVTEPVCGSLSNVLNKFSVVTGGRSGGGAGGGAGGGGAGGDKEVSLSPLEIKQGLLQVTDTLTFLHNEARMLHGGITPQVIMITSEGVWKLAGFGFTLPLDPSIQRLQRTEFSYDDPFPPSWDELSKPLLPYTAPEVVGGFSGPQHVGLPPLTSAADVFSLATCVFEVLCGGQQLLPVRGNLNEYRSKVEGLTRSTGLLSNASGALAAAPEALQGVLQSMLSLSPESRPPVASLTSNAYFTEDVLLRALKFLDTILQREHAQKAAFIQDLAKFWTQFDDRVLQLRVMPPLIQELRSELLQPVLLPLVLSMLERCTPVHFMSTLLPALQPVMDTAQGHLLGALLAGSGTLARLMTQEAVSRYLVPLYSRALDSEGAPQVQDLCLRMLQDSLPTLDYTLLKTQILPRTHSICMRTTTASVRVHALALMACAAARLDKAEAGTMIDTASQVVGVDKSAPTIMGVVQLAVAVGQAHGVQVTAGRLIPLIAPLMMAPALTPQEFRAVHGAVQGMLDAVADKMSRGSGHQAGGAAAGGSALGAPGTGQAGASTAGQGGMTSWDTPLDLPSHKPKQQQQLPQTATNNNGSSSSTGVDWLTAASTPLPPTSYAASTSSYQNPTSTASSAAAAAAAWDWSSAAPSTSNASTQGKPPGVGAGVGQGMTAQSSTAHQMSNGSNGASWSMGPLNSSGGASGGAGGGKPSGAPMMGSAGTSGGVNDLFGGLVLHGSGTNQNNNNNSIGNNQFASGSVKPAASSTQTLDSMWGLPSTASQASPSKPNMHASNSSSPWLAGGASGAGLTHAGGGGGGSVNGFSGLAGQGSGMSMSMQGKPMLGSTASGGADPFSSLAAMALTAPVAPSKPSGAAAAPPPAHHLGHGSKVGLLPPPPRASQALMGSSQPATPSAQAAGNKNLIDDLLF